MSSFKQKFTVQARKFEASKIIAKFPDRIPIICERSVTCTSLPPMDKRKFLVELIKCVDHDSIEDPSQGSKPMVVLQPVPQPEDSADASKRH